MLCAAFRAPWEVLWNAVTCTPEAVVCSADAATPEKVVQGLPLRKVSLEEPLKSCPICLEDMEPGSEVRTLPCEHFYHAACVEGWLKQKSSCPVCRGGMPTRMEPLDA